MRQYIVAIFLIAGLKIGTAQTLVEPNTNIACVERIQIPAFPPLARMARVEETINAAVLLSSRGSVRAISTGKGHPLFLPSVEGVIRAATFHSECAGKTVTLVFDFRLAGLGSEQPMQSVTFGAPNKFSITVKPLPPPVNQSTVRP